MSGTFCTNVPYSTYMELYYGAYKSQKVTGNLAKIKMLEQSIEMIPLGQESAEIFGMLKAQLEIQGNRLDDFDLAIASSALAHNLTLVTNNAEHFINKRFINCCPTSRHKTTYTKTKC